MCILFFAFGEQVQQTTGKSLVLLFNRDEGMDRETDSLHKWELKEDLGESQIYGGRDRVRKGTWLAVSSSPRPRFAVLTNFRVGLHEKEGIFGKRSRGEIILDYLKEENEDPLAFLTKLREIRKDYGYANIVVGSLGGEKDKPTWKIGHLCLKYDDPPTIFSEGVHVISNFPKEKTQIKKIRRGTELFKQALSLPSDPEIKLQPGPTPVILEEKNSFHSRCISILSDCCREENEEQLPETGCGSFIEHHLSSIFIPPATLPFTAPPQSCSSSSPIIIEGDHKAPYPAGLYGTRSCTCFSVSLEKEAHFTEYSLGESYKKWVKSEEFFSMN